jgi:site-specific DNA-methyltransferase (adenine-specific)
VVIQDGTENYCKTLTSFRMAVDWADAGWGLWETLIWAKSALFVHPSRFRLDHEYVFCFVKGGRPAHFNKSFLKVPTRHPGRTYRGTTYRLPNGEQRRKGERKGADLKCRGTIWEVPTSRGKSLPIPHPATFPSRLAADLILCFSKPGDLILDPYSGSGTTCIEAQRLGRRWLGIDISAEYTALAERRMHLATRQQVLDLEFAA